MAIIVSAMNFTGYLFILLHHFQPEKCVSVVEYHSAARGGYIQFNASEPDSQTPGAGSGVSPPARSRLGGGGTRVKQPYNYTEQRSVSPGGPRQSPTVSQWSTGASSAGPMVPNSPWWSPGGPAATAVPGRSHWSHSGPRRSGGPVVWWSGERRAVISH